MPRSCSPYIRHIRTLVNLEGLPCGREASGGERNAREGGKQMAVVLVTGTSSGIGLETALQFARRGDTVYAAMRNLERDGELREAAKSEGLSVHMCQLDVTDAASVERAVGEILKEQGRIDVLVNNAGLGGGMTFETTPAKQVREIFETNVLGAVWVTQAVLPAMRFQRSGAIVNISSMGGRVTLPGAPFYSASKWALESLSESLAIDLYRFNLRVAVIEPGMILTRFFEKAVAGEWDQTSPYADAEVCIMDTAARLLDNAGDPHQVAKAVEHAVTTNEPRLRYLVGNDAAALVDGRARLSDEEFVEALGREQSSEEYARGFFRRFPVPGAV